MPRRSIRPFTSKASNSRSSASRSAWAPPSAATWTTRSISRPRRSIACTVLATGSLSLAVPGQPDNFDTLTPDAIRGFIDQVLGMIAAVVVPVTCISLVVGGIVIMNIMLVSVTERTREIGIRKAVGARHGDIMTQILIEAVVLASVG